MPNTQQQLKAYGWLPHIEAADVNRASATVDEKAAALVLTERTCGHPDNFDLEIAEANPSKLADQLDMPFGQCQGLVEAHKRMAAYNGQKWGRCYPDFYDGPAVRYYLDIDTFPDHYTRSVTDEELQQVVEAGVWGMTLEQVRDEYAGKPMVEVAYDVVDIAYARVGIKHIRATDGPDGDHNVHIKSVPIPGSTIGVAWFPSGDCDDHVNHHIDSTYRPGLMGTMKLGCHEWGHNHGEPHQFTGQNEHQSVMSYTPPRLFYGFSTGQAPYPLPRDKSIDSLIEKYGGPIIGEPDTPDPLPPVPSDGPQIELDNDVLTVKGPIPAGESRRFIIVPATEV